MPNLTITLNEDLLRKARLRALEQGTSVNAVVRSYLEQYTGAKAARQTLVENVLRISRGASSRSGGRTWARDELHER